MSYDDPNTIPPYKPLTESSVISNINRCSPKRRSPSFKKFKEDTIHTTEPTMTVSAPDNFELKPQKIKNKENYMSNLIGAIGDVEKKLPKNLDLKRASPVRTKLFPAGTEYVRKQQRYEQTHKDLNTNKSYSPIKRRNEGRSYSPKRSLPPAIMQRDEISKSMNFGRHLSNNRDIESLNYATDTHI
jgi:hypothetical protein